MDRGWSSPHLPPATTMTLSFFPGLCPIPGMFEDNHRLLGRLIRCGLGARMSGLLVPPVLAQPPAPVFMRYPTIHGESVVFEACGNLWLINRKGGTAQRLTTDPGFDILPRFSPDGKYIAFTGQYQQNSDVYLIPATGGGAKPLTFHFDVGDDCPLRLGADNMVGTWTAHTKNNVVFFRRHTP